MPLQITEHDAITNEITVRDMTPDEETAFNSTVEISPTPAEKIMDRLSMTVADLKKLLGLPA